MREARAEAEEKALTEGANTCSSGRKPSKKAVKRGETGSGKLLEGTEGWVDWLPPEAPKELDEMGELKRLAGITPGYALPKLMTAGDRARPQAQPTDGVLDPVSTPATFGPRGRR